MTSGSVSGWQIFSLVYFLVLLVALGAALAYRRLGDRELRRRLEELVRHRSSLYGMLGILARESQELAARTDEDLTGWLAAGPSSWPEGQALRDVDSELGILAGELATMRTPQSLGNVTQELVGSVERTRSWIARVLSARSVEGIRAALAARVDGQAGQELERANEGIRQFAREHGIKDQDSF